MYIHSFSLFHYWAFVLTIGLCTFSISGRSHQKSNFSPCFSAKEIIRIIEDHRGTIDADRIKYIKEGEQAVKLMTYDPPIPVINKKIQSFDTKRSNTKSLISGFAQMQLVVDGVGLIGLSDIHTMSQWLKQVTKFFLATVRLTKSKSTEQLIAHLRSDQTINGFTEYILKDLPDHATRKRRSRIQELFSNFDQNETSEMLEKYHDEFIALLKLFPKVVTLQTNTKKLKAEYDALVQAQEALLIKKLEVDQIDIPKPTENLSKRVVLVIILPGTGSYKSGIHSTFGYHHLIKRAQKNIENNQDVQYIPISIGYPFNGGPTGKKYNYLPNMRGYIVDIIDRIQTAWGLDKNSSDIAVLGRSTGGTLALDLHGSDPERFSNILAASPMLSDPTLHINPALASDYLAEFSKNGQKGADDFITKDQEVPWMNVWASSLIVQSFFEDRIIKSQKLKNVKVLWSDLDPAYPEPDKWIPRIQKKWANVLQPIILEQSRAHNVFTNEMVNNSPHGEMLLKLMTDFLRLGER